MSDPAADFYASPVLTFELLEAFRRFSPKTKVAYLSSAAVYGDPESLPITEEHATHPVSPYGYHKRLGELLLEEYARIYNLPAFSVRIFSAYGVGLRRQVVWDICERALTTGRLTLRGTGRESRDFVHAADVVRALATLLEKADGHGEVYNVAAGEETTIAEIAQVLLRSLGLELEPQFDGEMVPGNPHRWRADISRLTALGYTREVPLETGLSSVAQWALAELGAPRTA
jgi:UDP-glucose 4-epimerase